MSERWKYQLKIGSIWGISFSVIMAAFDLSELSFKDAFLSKENLFRTLYFVLAGIFIVGYSNWKKKIKRENSVELSNNNPVNK